MIKKVWGNDVSFRWHITERKTSGEVVDYDISAATNTEVLIGYWNEKTDEYPKEMRMASSRDAESKIIARVDPDDDSYMIVTIKGDAPAMQKPGRVCATLRCNVGGTLHRCTDENLFEYVNTTNETKAPGAQDGEIGEDEVFEAESIVVLVGPAGKSAYESAVDGGYTGTEKQFAGKLALLPGLVSNSNYLGLFATLGEFEKAYQERYDDETQSAWGWLGGDMTQMQVINCVNGTSTVLSAKYDLTDFAAVKNELTKVAYLSRSEYDALVESGTVDENMTYNIWED